MIVRSGEILTATQEASDWMNERRDKEITVFYSAHASEKCKEIKVTLLDLLSQETVAPPHNALKCRPALCVQTHTVSVWPNIVP